MTNAISFGGLASSLMTAYGQFVQPSGNAPAAQSIPEQKGIPAVQPQNKEGTQELDERCLGMVVQHY